MTLTQRFDDLVQRQSLLPDPAQRAVAAELDALAERLTHKPPSPPFWQRWLASPPPAAQGLYLYGSVGRGKTMLCDWFVDHYAARITMRRLHFHAFMNQIHNEITALGQVSDPLPKIAALWASHTDVLVLDEMQVNDITDAMIMAGLFEALFAAGVSLLTTSNIAPENLYLNGLQRENFLPTIALLNTHCQVLSIADGEDFRRRTLIDAGTLLCGDHAAADLDAAYERLCGAAPSKGRIEINQRHIETKGEHADLAYFSFHALCETPRSAPDYLALSRRYQTVILGPVPRLSDAQRDALRRFINLVDEFYDHGTKLVLGCATPIDQLYDGSTLAFEFTRCRSRLTEMGSEQYLHQPHRSL